MKNFFKKYPAISEWVQMLLIPKKYEWIDRFWNLNIFQQNIVIIFNFLIFLVTVILSLVIIAIIWLKFFYIVVIVLGIMCPLYMIYMTWADS